MDDERGGGDDVPKVLVYVVRRRGGQLELLVHEHRDAPAAGVQVPAGTVDHGETPAAAAARELYEESGLRLGEDAAPLQLVRVYRWRHDDGGRWHLRHVFVVHLDEPRDRWTHTITGDGDDRGLAFCYCWIPLSDAKRVLCGD